MWNSQEFHFVDQNFDYLLNCSIKFYMKLKNCVQFFCNWICFPVPFLSSLSSTIILFSSFIFESLGKINFLTLEIFCESEFYLLNRSIKFYMKRIVFVTAFVTEPDFHFLPVLVSLFIILLLLLFFNLLERWVF